MTSPTPLNKALKDVGEFALIDRLSGFMRGTLASGVRGAGDDCAAIPLAGNSTSLLLMTTDTMVEDRHFCWDYTSAFDLGWKLLAVNLSDIAAAGGAPLAAVLTLQLRSELETATVEEIYRGAAALAKKYNVSLVGGDTTSSPVIALGATLIGLCENPLSRFGAKPGDDLWVSGVIGLGGLGLAFARNELSPGEFPDLSREAEEKYCRPEPRCDLGQVLSERRLASAAIDLSDGLIQDAGHLSKRSDVGLEIELERVPVRVVPNKWAPLHACTAGDDYELLFTAPSKARQDLERLSGHDGLPILSRIGSVRVRQIRDRADVNLRSHSGTSEPAENILQKAGLNSGYNHFKQTGC